MKDGDWGGTISVGALTASLLLSPCAIGCASAPSGFATTTRFPPEPPRAPAVAIDPKAELPEATASAPTSQPLAVLAAPMDIGAAQQTVRRFIEAAVLEDADTMGQLLEPQAQMRADSRGTRWQARAFWQLRFARLDYTQLKGRLVYRESMVETWVASDDRPSHARPPPFDIEPPQVLVRVPVLTRSVDGQALFGDEIDFVLVPFRTGFRIASIAEAFHTP